jgi:hypothetical protein
MDSNRSVVDTSALHLRDVYAPPQEPHRTGLQCSLCHNTLSPTPTMSITAIGKVCYFTSLNNLLCVCKDWFGAGKNLPVKHDVISSLPQDVL